MFPAEGVPVAVALSLGQITAFDCTQGRDRLEITGRLAQRGMNWHSRRPTGKSLGWGGGGGGAARWWFLRVGEADMRRHPTRVRSDKQVGIISLARWMLGIRARRQSGYTHGALRSAPVPARDGAAGLQTPIIAYQAVIMDFQVVDIDKTGLRLSPGLQLQRLPVGLKPPPKTHEPLSSVLSLL